MSVGNLASRQLRCFSQSFECAILFACQRIDHSKIVGQHRTFDGALADGHQLDCALAFACCVSLVSQRSVNDAERTESRRIVRLVTYDLLDFLSRVDEFGTSRRVISAKTGDKPPAPTVR